MVESLKWGMSRRLVLAERSARRPGMSATRVAMKSASTAAGENELYVWWHTVATYLAQQNNGEWIGLSSLNDKKFKSLKTTYLILTKFLQGVRTTNEPSWVVSTLKAPNKSKMAAAAILNFGKVSITPYWIKISAPNIMGRYITAMKWPHDQRLKPEAEA